MCSLGHPMVIKLGPHRPLPRVLALPRTSSETRPLPGEEPETPAVEGVGEPCPECGEGVLVARRGRFGPFAGCSRYPECELHQARPARRRPTRSRSR